MSDQSPPTKPKPGSLRDRIAAFENKGGATPGPTPGAPVPRPKPGNIQWKPRPPSPSSSPDLSSKIISSSGNSGSGGSGGMSASDAKESISRGGTLKERMAALQGKGAFGDPSPALSVSPKPVIEKPKWKPPQASPPPINDGVAGRAASPSPPPKRMASPSSDMLSKADEGEADAAATEGDRGSPEPEEEERQRRAAIAARMARLGGARIGMAPPVIAPKPAMRRSSVLAPASSPPPAPEPVQEKSWTQEQETLQPSQVADEPPRRGSLGSASIKDEITAEPESSLEPKDADQASIGSASSSRAPTSMPVPAGPRRAAPPRRKTYKSPPSGPLPDPPAPVPVPAQLDSAMADGALPSSDGAVSETPKFPPSEEPTVSLPDEMLVSDEVYTDISKSMDVSGDAHVAPVQQDEVDEEAVLVKQPTGLINEPESMEEDLDPLQKKGEVSIKGSSMYETAEDEHHGAVLDTEPEQDQQEQQPESEPEPEEDEATRCKRVADKLATMGAFNPLDPSFSVSPRACVEEPVDADTEQVAENIPATITVPPIVEETEDQHVHSTPEVDVEETKVELEVGEQEEYEHGTVQPAPVERDDEHETDLERAHEPTLSTEAEVTRRVLYHNTGVDDDGELERAVSPSLDVDAVDTGPSQFLHQENRSDIPIKRTSVCSRKGGTEPPSVLATDVEMKVGMYTDTNAGATMQAALDGNEDVTPASQDDDDDIALPHPSRPIPPPPVVVGSNPALLSSPLPKKVLQTLKDDEDERAASPDIPPRPIPPPPMRSASDATEGDARGHAQRSILPPPRRTSLGVTEPPVGAPIASTSPSVQTSPPRPTCRPTSPPILTVLPMLQEPGQMGGDVSALEEQQTGVQEPEDDESARRRTIAERMARLGGIRFGAPPSMHHLARPPMPPVPPPTSIPPDDAETEITHKDNEEDEAARKERIAAKLAGMGGTRFGMLPTSVPVGMAPASARRLVSKQEDSESEDVALPVPAPASQRGPPSRKLPPPVEPEPEKQDLGGSRVLSDDGVKVEAEESEIEEVHYSDADVRSEEDEEQAPPLPPPRHPVATSKPLDALPTPPPRSPPGRPPVPALPGSLLARRASGTAASVSSRNSSADYSSTAGTPVAPSRARTSQEGISFDNGFRPQSEYVMVEVDPEPEETPAPPPRRPTRAPPPSIPLPPPPPPSAIDPPEDLAFSAQWELPSIPQGAEFIADSDVASSGWSDDSTAVHAAPPPPPPQAPVLPNILSIAPSTQATPAPSRHSTSSIDQEQVLSIEELMTVWGKVGAQVAQAASELFEKSKRTLVGDGSYVGFVRAVLAQVPGALRSSDPEEWGYVIYAQTGTTVQRRVVDIMPGDVIAFWDAKLKGYKALHTYSQTTGAGESGALVGVVSEFEPKKMKVRVWQANQHVGQQTVENVSYRLEDLKSGRVKIYRILEKAM